MPSVAIQTVEEGNLRARPILEHAQQRREDLRRRAFQRFEQRGCECGHELDDWLAAEQELLGWSASEMAENERQYELRMALPGFDAKELEVAASPSEIVVHARTKLKKKTRESNVIWTQFHLNEVYRHFELSQPIQVDKIRATVDNGILRITAAKAAAKQRQASGAAAG